MMRTTNRILGAAALMGCMAFAAVSAGAAEVGDVGDEASNQIVVVNQSAGPVRVYLDDSQGRQYDLGSLGRGQTKMFQAPADAVERGDFRVRIRPRYYAQRFRDPVSIATKPLNIQENETVILWIERELGRSKVEVREG